MASRHSSTGRRLAALERQFAVSDDPSSRQEVLWDRINRGNAGLDEFAEFMGGYINAYRAMLITRSVYYALVRFHGWEPWASRPQHVAASILGVPLSQTVPQVLLESSSRMVDESLRRPSGESRRARFLSNPELHRIWVQQQMCALALGAPDGLPLRTEMVDGNWAGAIEYTMDHPKLSEEAIVNVPSCGRWHELSDDFVRPIPSDMTEEEARQAHPPWDQWRQWDWWPPPKYSLDGRLEKARRTSSCRLFIEELPQFDNEHITTRANPTNDRKEPTE